MSAKLLLRKTSLVDYPGRISSVLFFCGCNLRCPWCHNRELVLAGATGLSGAEDALAHLHKRRSMLGGVVLSGGEPCLYEELPELVREIRKLRLPVKLDTNGLFPGMLGKLMQAEDTRPSYIALDLKIAPRRYGELLPACGAEIAHNPGAALAQAAALIRESGISREYRTLVLPGGYITENDIEALAPLADGAPWYFRPFRAGNCLDPAWNGLEEPASKARARAEALAQKARDLGKNGKAL